MITRYKIARIHTYLQTRNTIRNDAMFKLLKKPYTGMPPPDIGRSINPISTRGANYTLPTPLPAFQT